MLFRSKEYLDNKHNLSEILQLFGVNREQVVQLQANFTPKNIADEIIKLSGIANDDRDNLFILEPTAGVGNLINCLSKNKNISDYWHSLRNAIFR